MKNIFAARKDFVEGRKRNTFDLSFQNNLTMKFGRLYPVFCKEVIPGDSFRIKPTFGLRFMPLTFPVQTRMQANLHFFYVRNRTLWKDWMDFIGRTKDGLVPPYLSAQMAKELCKTGALGDYLGVPTTIAGEYGAKLTFDPSQFNYSPSGTNQQALYPMGTSQTVTPPSFPMGIALSTMIANYGQGSYQTYYSSSGIVTPSFDLSLIKGSRHVPTLYFDTTLHIAQSNSYVRFQDGFFTPYEDDWRQTTWLRWTSNGNSLFYYLSDLTISNLKKGDEIPVTSDSAGSVVVPYYKCIVLEDAVQDPDSPNYYRVKVKVAVSLNDDCMVSIQNETTRRFPAFVDYLVQTYGSAEVRFYHRGYYSNAMEYGAYSPNYEGPTLFEAQYGTMENSDISQVVDVLNPYASGDLHVSALPFRAYEAIYNAYYRNQQNDPFKINGVPEYNKYITTDTGGSDNTVYDFFNRNWELDFLTSANQTPQQGDITPLVGVSASGEFTFDNGDGTTTTVTPTLGPDGSTLTGIAAYEGKISADGSLPSGVRRLQQLIPYGISINDFRNVNALQRWLETNLRRGYKYRDQIKSHFDVDVEYKELDMPEFIGGVSEPVLVNQVNQNVDQTESGFGDWSKVLGSFAGQASILASSEHDISHYCDEHGFIIGIMSISPVPNYSQLLPKHLIKDNVLDYYFPEFGHIGNQPVTYREVCPLQSFISRDSLDDVFGYQRAWYEYIASVDEVHGDMRLSLRNFLINRVFNERPELGAKFLQIDNEDINDIFSVTEDTDKIIGQIYFEVFAQRPIPKFGIPRLE